MNIVDWMSSSPLLLATANLVAAVAAIVIVFKVLKQIGRFLKSVYDSSVITAIRRLKRRAFYRAYYCARDVHVYISYLVERSAQLLVCSVTVITVNGMGVKSRQEFIDNPPHIWTSTYEDYVKFAEFARISFTVFQLIVFLFAAFICVRLIIVSRNVTRLRWRWEARRQRGSGEDIR